jgi:hypothetical protein
LSPLPPDRILRLLPFSRKRGLNWRLLRQAGV